MLMVLQKNNCTELPEEIQGLVVLINKPADWTSFDVVKKIRNIVRGKKTGHSGTLDPFAEGLMLIGIGRGTKQLADLSALSKSYRAVVQFGVETDSYDCTGNITAENDPGGLDQQAIENALQSMRGEIEQVPPMFSAKKQNGVRLYKLARKNIEIERKAVKVTIHDVKIINWQPPDLELLLDVSKGTYIRSYAHDLGQKLGPGASLKELERLTIDKYKLEDSFAIREFEAFWKDRGAGVKWK